jgi:hypothetical protein
MSHPGAGQYFDMSDQAKVSTLLPMIERCTIPGAFSYHLPVGLVWRKRLQTNSNGGVA